MGQVIAVESRVVDDVALLSGDRSLTGTAGEAYTSPDEAAASTTFPGVLAQRMFEEDSAIDHVYIFSNDVVVRRRGGWDEASLGAVTLILSNFFVFYGDGSSFAPAYQGVPFPSPSQVTLTSLLLPRNRH